MNRLRKKIAGMLAVIMLVTLVPAGNVMATEIPSGEQEKAFTEQEQEDTKAEEPMKEAGETVVDEVMEPEMKDEEVVKPEEQPEDVVKPEEQPAEEAAQADEQQKEVVEEANTETINERSENRLNYVYIEHPYLTTGEEQQIVVSWGDGTEAIQDMRIMIQDENGHAEEWQLSNQAGPLYLFSKTYNDAQVECTYEVVNIIFTESESAQQFKLADLGVEAKFGVNKEYDGIEELQPLYVEESETAGLETAVVTIDENGETKNQDGIAEALAEVGGDANKFKMGRASDIVVALDPGHDSRHAGASASGLREEILTLKIANYAKAELETYSGVKVHMTRTTATCPSGGSSSSGACIAKRVEAAAAAGAKIFVSMHLNSSTASGPNGAEVIIPNNSWKPQVGAEGKALAEKIIAELAAVGLNKRPTPIYSKDTTIDERYEDGSISDYFSVQIYAKEAGIPGIIVEHAFMTNTNDANKFLKTEAGLKKLGVADATGIVKYLGLAKKGSGAWEQVGDKWKYKLDGQYVVSRWMTISGDKYYFDFQGYRVTGWQDIGNERYYFMQDGHMHTGWLSFGEIYYYMMSDGHMHTGWLSFGNIYYYLDNLGVRQTGWQTISGKKYYFMSDGHRHTGWLSFGNVYYYLNGEGVVQTGKQTINGREYYFGNDGKLIEANKKVGWHTENGQKYYYSNDGVKATGWQTIDGKKYYFMTDGHMHIGWLSFGSIYYFLNSEGVVQTGWQTIGGKKYYFMSDGHRHTGWLSFGNIYYYLNAEGIVQTGWQTIDGKKYYFMTDGHRHTGWLSFGNIYYYLNGEGVVQTGWQTISGKKYYFMSDGHRHTGWLSFGNIYYYLNGEGVVQTGKQIINGREYYFGNDGKLIEANKKVGWHTENGKKYYYSNDGVKVTGWQTIDSKKYYFMTDGHMHIGWLSFGSIYYFLNSEGVVQTGWQTIDGKKYYFMTDGHRHTGWLSFGNIYYYLNAEGVVQTGWQTIGGKKYYFMSDGHRHTGWLSFADIRYYLDDSGVVQTDWTKVEGEWYYFNASGILTKNTTENPPNNPKVLIEGTSSITAEKLASFYKSKGAVYPRFYEKSDAPTLVDFCQIYIEEAKAEEIRADIAFVQAMLETGWLRFGGAVNISQYNFAGIGAVDGGANGAKFKDVRQGVRAQIQHLKAYANKKPLFNSLVDPRFHLVKRGNAPYVEWLGIKENPTGAGWASGKSYGYKIIRLINELK